MGLSENINVNNSPNEPPRVAQREAWIQKGTFIKMGGKTARNHINSRKCLVGMSGKNTNEMAKPLSSKNPKEPAIADIREGKSLQNLQ